MDKWAKKRARIEKRYAGPEWQWHFRGNGSMWVGNKITKEAIDLGKIEGGICRKPQAIPDVLPG